MRFGKRALWFLLTYVLLVILMFSVPMFIHRQDFDRAFSAWYTNRTPENETALRIQQHKNTVINLEFSAVGAFVLLAVGYGLYALVRATARSLKPRKSSSD